MHHILNIAPWGCLRKKWLADTGHQPDYEPAYNPALVRGTKGESLAAEEYASQTGRKLRNLHSELTDKDIPQFSGHIDRHIVAFDERGPGVLEVKCPGEHMFRKIKADGLPQAYIAQLQWYMMLTGWRWGSYAIMHLDSWKLMHWDMERDDELTASMREQAAHYLRIAENGPEPDRLDPKDKRCGSCEFRRSCQGEALLAGVDSASDLVVDAALGGVVQEYMEAKQIEDEAGELVAEARGRLEAAMNNRQVVDTTGARVYWKVQVSKRIDTNLLRKKYPMIACEVEKESVSRPLRVFPI